MDRRAQTFHLFFQSKLSPLKLSNARLVGRRSAGFIVNGAVKGFMPGAKFANTSFDSHGLRLHADGD